MTAGRDALLEMTGITREFAAGGAPRRVLRGVDFRVKRGEAVAIVGPSGSGKSTLLHIAATLDRPTSGELHLGGRNLLTLNAEEVAQVRNREIGLVFQLHHLLPQLNVLENILVPALLGGVEAPVQERALRLLDRVGLSDHLKDRPGRLSGGERQRVAVVRSLINRPALLLADEPTGSLSNEGAVALAQLLLELNAEEQMALVVVTHSMRIARMMNHVLELIDGRLRPLSNDA